MDMHARVPKAGVCIIRVEAQSDRTLITVTMDGDIGQNVRGAPLERIMRFAEADDALAVVAQFLRSFNPSTPCAG
jgi:hypothetical protein